MGWRYKKYITIFPGVRLNISKSGVSFTFGTKGASVNVAKDGAYLNSGIPGTGFYNRKKIYSVKDNCDNNLHNLKPSINMDNSSDPIVNKGIKIDDPKEEEIHFSPIEDDEENKSKIGEQNIIPENEINITSSHLTSVGDPKLYDVAKYIVENQLCRTSNLQRYFAIGYNRTMHIINQLEKIGIIEQSPNHQYIVLVKHINNLNSLFSQMESEDVPENIFGITEDYYNDVSEIVHSLVKLYIDIKKDTTIMYAISDSLPPNYGDREQKLAALFHADIMKIYQHFGHSTTNLKNREGFALVLLSSLILGENHSLDLRYNTINVMENLSKTVPSIFSSLNHIFDQYPDDNFFFIGQVLNRCRRRSFYTRYFTLLYRLFSIIAKADGSISNNEAKWLKTILELTPQRENVNIVFNVEGDSYKQSVLSKTESNKPKINPQESNPTKELNKLIGLSNVKMEINSLSNLVKIQQVRKNRGMSVSNISYHCVFTGNPGTGKTTVARIVAEIYKDLGVLNKGQLIETDRSGLVGEYVGQTAPKTNAIIDSALDGVLFIDEAYSLVQGGQNDYGMEAISTLLKRMEDDRDRLVVILAGYSKEMDDFINANSGLQSRFNRYIMFPDYSSEELMQIFNYIAKKNDYYLSKEAEKKVMSVIVEAIKNKDKNFGNARFVRNLFEKIITQQANRIASVSKITNEILAKIEEIDIINALNK